jgi:hypothetical protein
LINGKNLIITPEMKKFFHPSLLEKDPKTGKPITNVDGEIMLSNKILNAYPRLEDTAVKPIAM